MTPTFRPGSLRHQSPATISNLVPMFLLALAYNAKRLKQPGVYVLLAGTLALALLMALLERAAGSGAVDRSLTGVCFGGALPLAIYFLARHLCRGEGLTGSLWALAKHGADRRVLALALCSVLVAAGGLFGAILGTGTVLATRGLADAALLRDLWASASVGTLAGAAYACALTLASTFGARGGGRTAFLLLDWVLGASASAVALPFPRAHVLNLLGATPPLGLSQASSGLLLVATIFLCLALAIYRIPR